MFLDSQPFHKFLCLHSSLTQTTAANKGKQANPIALKFNSPICIIVIDTVAIIAS